MNTRRGDSVLRTIDLQADIDNWRMPGHIAARISTFLLDRCTGNVTLNIKNGEIMGAHVQEIVVARSDK